MTIHYRLSMLGACLGLIATSVMPAAAKERPVSDPGNVRRILAEGVQCLVDSKPTSARRFIAMFPDSKDAARQAGYFNKNECIVSATGAQDIDFSPALYRGAIYRSFYIEDFGAKAPELLPNMPNFAGDTSGQAEGPARDYVVMRQFAECVVRKNPATSRDLVLAPIESDNEQFALQSLQPGLDTCLIQGGSAKISRAMMTGLIAEALYRVSAPTSVALSR